MGDFEEVGRLVHDRISSLRRTLDLSFIDFPQSKMRKLGQEIFALEKLLEDFESCVDRQRDQLSVLKELEASLHKHLEDASHMTENVPAHLPKKGAPYPACEALVKASDAADVQQSQQEQMKKSSRISIRQMDFITVAEFDSIPQYMRGRVSYDQLNAAVQNINTSVTAKYKILHQPIRSLNNQSRKLQQRFKEQETKDTKGQFFVAEDDIRDFSQVKLDKRFQGILNMLRHCQRIRELRGGGLTRYLLL